MIPAAIQLIGEGNVSFHLARGLAGIEGVESVRVYSRSQKNRQLFETTHKAITTHPLQAIKDEAPLTIIAVSDDAITHVASLVNAFKSLIVHTSGSTPIRVLAQEGIARYGSFYPLQTFSMKRLIDWRGIPLLTDAQDADDLGRLDELAMALSGNVHRADDTQRQSTHVAAVFVNNFVNHLFVLGERWLDQHALPFEVLLPLIRETVEKLNYLAPLQAQTGPARRHDALTLQKHLNLLAGTDHLEAVYRLLTSSIEATYSKDTEVD